MTASQRRLPSGVLYKKEEQRVPRGYVFICSDRTEEECLNRMLFAEREAYWAPFVSKIREVVVAQVSWCGHPNLNLHDEERRKGIFVVVGSHGAGV